MPRAARPAAPPTTVIWRSPPIEGAEWLRGSYSDFSYAPHAHDAECLCVLTRGAIRIRAGGAEVIARQGDVFTAHTGAMHAGWPIDADGWSLRTVYVDLADLHTLSRDGGRHRAGTLDGPLVRDPELAARLVTAHECSEGSAPALRRDEALIAFADHLFERHVRPAQPAGAPGLAPQAVRRAREFLDAHLDVRVSLADLAAVTDLPASRLLRAFARAVGMSPHVYQRLGRLRYATALIRDGWAISQAALAAGFADQAHFTRLFQRTMGMPPGAYQRGCGRAAWRR
jgi:AraC-like DNA-binding protein